jgi:hypothetical protein
VVSRVDLGTFILVPWVLMFSVVGLWLLQLLIIEGQKRFLHQLKHRHEPLIRFTNFVGIFFQTLCQWLGYTVTHSGVSEFHLSIDEGSVRPKREKKGFLKWVADGFLFLGPFLIPAGLLLLAGYFVIGSGYVIPNNGFSVQGQMTSYGQALAGFVESFVSFLTHLDLLNPPHFAFLVFLLFCGLGIRPSYLGVRRKEKVTFFTDLGNIKSLFLDKPVYLVGIVVVVFVFATVSYLFEAMWFLNGIVVVSWIALIAILMLILTFVLLVFVRTLDEIKPRFRYLPFLSMIVSYVGFRVLFYVVPIENAQGASLFGMLGVTLAVTIVLLKWKAVGSSKRG